MSMNDAALIPARQVDALLTRYVVIHDACFKFSLRRIIPIPGIYREIDFRRHHLDLIQIYVELQETKLGIDAAIADRGLSPEWASFLKGLSEYSGSVAETVGCLGNICEQLSSKSRGKAYCVTKYRDDLAGYEASVKRYLAQGDQLNKLLAAAVGGG